MGTGSPVGNCGTAVMQVLQVGHVCTGAVAVPSGTQCMRRRNIRLGFCMGWLLNGSVCALAESLTKLVSTHILAVCYCCCTLCTPAEGCCCCVLVIG